MKLVVPHELGIANQQVSDSLLFRRWHEGAGGRYERVIVDSVDRGNGLIHRLALRAFCDGRSTHFVLGDPWINVLVVLTDGAACNSVVLREQFSVSLGTRILSSFTGMIDSDESPEGVAYAEVQEKLELDDVSKIDLTRLITTATAPSATNEVVHHFRATIKLSPSDHADLVRDLHGRQIDRLPGGEPVVLRVVDYDEALPLIRRSVVVDGNTLQALSCDKLGQ